MELYKEKEKGYYTKIRSEFKKEIPKNPDNKILEVGAGDGSTLIYLKNNGYANEIHGIELNIIPNSNQQDPILDKMTIGNIEHMDLSHYTNYFNVILCGDVLEHLIDPWTVVEKLSTLLKKDGLLIVSIPNIADYQFILKLIITKRFKYESFGVLDKTHLRFFGKKDIYELIGKGNFNKIKIIPLINYNPRSLRNLFNKLTLGFFENYLTNQYLVLAQK